MKRRGLIDNLRALAKSLDLELDVTEGGNHTKVRIGDQKTTIPRHNEINEHTAQSILKHMKGSR